MDDSLNELQTMSEPQHHRLIVLGSGPAGYTAALYAARANLKPILITGVEVGGQLTTTTEVENWPGGHAELQGPELMMQMSEHVDRFDAEIVNDHIHTAQLDAQPFTLIGDQATWHLAADAPLTSDIDSLARPVSRCCELVAPRCIPV